MNQSVVVLVSEFLFIAVRKIGNFTIKIWQSMTGSAIIVVATQQIGGVNAIKAIDIEVMLFLLGMFIIGQALVVSGYLYYVAYSLFGGFKSAQHLVMVFSLVRRLGRRCL